MSDKRNNVTIVVFWQNVFKNSNRRNTDKLYKGNVHINKVGFYIPSSRSLTLMYPVVIGYPRNIRKSVISKDRVTT